MRFTGQFLCLILAAPLFFFVAKAQDEPIRVDTDLVTVNIAVADGKGKAVENLRREQFEIFDDGVKQQIEYFSAEEAAITFGIVFDTHPTTTGRTNAVLEALRQFTKELPEKDDFFFVAFNERGSLNLDFVPAADQLEKHLARPERREPRSLYDALYLAAENLRGRKNLKKILLVITDSKDHGSRHNFSDLRERLRSFDVQIYAVTPDDARNERWIYDDITRRRMGMPRSENALERAALNDLTMKSGGVTFSSALESQREFYEISKQIADETRRQYTISFYPAREADGKRHLLSVRLRSAGNESKKWVLTYRQDYQSPAVKIKKSD